MGMRGKNRSNTKNKIFTFPARFYPTFGKTVKHSKALLTLLCRTFRFEPLRTIRNRKMKCKKRIPARYSVLQNNIIPLFVYSAHLFFGSPGEHLQNNANHLLSDMQKCPLTTSKLTHHREEAMSQMGYKDSFSANGRGDLMEKPKDVFPFNDLICVLHSDIPLVSVYTNSNSECHIK